MRVNRVVCGISAALLLLSIATLWLHLRKDVTAGAPEHTQVLSVGALPLVFEANRGQTNSQVEFLARGGGATVFLTSRGFMLKRCNDDEMSGTSTCDAQEMRLVGANPDPDISGLEPLPGVSNYFIGNDSNAWYTDVPHYGRVRYEQVYPGIDLVFYGNQGQLEYDFIIAPGVDPAAIQLQFPGARDLAIDADGNLIVSTSAGELLQRAPVIYQDSNGVRRGVRGGYLLSKDDLVGFRVGAYDEASLLTIDPLLAYSTYMGGAGNDIGRGIAVDREGNVFITGETGSADFPTDNAPGQNLLGTTDAFVAKIAPGGGTLLFATYLGGSSGDSAHDVALDEGNNIYLTGNTSSTDFPTNNAPQDDLRGSTDAYMVKINPSGSALLYGTYLGGGSYDYGDSIAIDPSGSIYLIGETRSSDFPTSSALYGSLAGTFDSDKDLFIVKLPATVAPMLWSTYLGGSAADEATSLAVDDVGNVYVTGRTYSSDFPTAYPHQPDPGGATDAFVAQVHFAGGALGYSTFLGGSGGERGTDIWVDRGRNAYVASETTSDDFPTVNAYQPERGGAADAAITKFAPDGSLAISTYLGRSSSDWARGIRTDDAGNIFVAGVTESTDFPTVNAFQPSLAGASDIFVALLTPGARSLEYSTFLGGTANDSLHALAIGEQGAAYIVGDTTSFDFPTVGPVQPEYGGGAYDAYVAKLTMPLDFFIVATPPVGATTPAMVSSEGEY